MPRDPSKELAHLRNGLLLLALLLQPRLAGQLAVFSSVFYFLLLAAFKWIYTLHFRKMDCTQSWALEGRRAAFIAQAEPPGLRWRR